jgi:NTE family protein
VLRLLASPLGEKPAMVQRGYYGSTEILLERFFPFAHRRLRKYQCTVVSTCRSHRVACPVYETVTPVAHELHSKLRGAAEPPVRPSIGLAFGGGFARGYAHLGVLKVFEERQIPISCLAGSSIGSILAAAYASGAPFTKIVEKCREIRFRDFARWRVSRFGLASNDRLGALVQHFFDSRQFEDLDIPTAIVATDLGTGDPVVFTRGNLAEAIRASCAFPGLFEPIQIGTRYLADGGLVAPVPTRAARQLGAQLVIGVCVGLHDGQRGAPTNIFQVVSRAVSAAQKHQLESWERYADIVLRPSVQSLAWDDFARIDEAIEAGASAATSALPHIRKLLDLHLHQEEAFQPGRQGEFLFAQALR